ncbi:hypothetical protein D1872_344370 [compost metagenome]
MNENMFDLFRIQRIQQPVIQRGIGLRKQYLGPDQLLQLNQIVHKADQRDLQIHRVRTMFHHVGQERI